MASFMDCAMHIASVFSLELLDLFVLMAWARWWMPPAPNQFRVDVDAGFDVAECI